MSMEWIKKNKSLITTAVIIPIVLGVIFFLMAREKVELYYEMSSIPVISQNSLKPLNSRLKINYSGKDIENLTITEVKFFNKGKKGIKGEDISSNIPVAFKIDEKYKILEYEIDKKTTSEESEFLLSPQKNNQVTVKFKYMNPDNSLTFRVIHTGVVPSNISFSGKGFGFSKIKEYSVGKNQAFKLYYPLLAVILAYVLSLLIFGPLILSKMKKYIEDKLAEFEKVTRKATLQRLVEKIASDEFDIAELTELAEDLKKIREMENELGQ